MTNPTVTLTLTDRETALLDQIASLLPVGSDRETALHTLFGLYAPRMLAILNDITALDQPEPEVAHAHV